MRTASSRACLLLLNGEIPEAAPVRAAARRSRGVVCADGGVRHAPRLGLRPDYIVGDMDSLPRPLPRLPSALYWCDFDEDRSDFEKALAFIADLGCRRVYVAGALGGRLDHALVNLAVFERWSRVLDLVLLDRGSARLLGPGSVGLARGEAFSLAAAPRARVSLSGARYPLKRFLLEPGSRGLSNRALAGGRLTVHEGRLWLLQTSPAP